MLKKSIMVFLFSIYLLSGCGNQPNSTITSSINYSLEKPETFKNWSKDCKQSWVELESNLTNLVTIKNELMSLQNELKYCEKYCDQIWFNIAELKTTLNNMKPKDEIYSEMSLLKTKCELKPIEITKNDYVDPVEDMVAVVPASGSFLCVHPDYKNEALERFGAVELNNGLYAIKDSNNTQSLQLDVELIITENPVKCSELNPNKPKDSKAVDKINDLAAVMNNQGNKLCIKPGHEEAVLAKIGAEYIEHEIFSQQITNYQGEIISLSFEVIVSNTFIPCGVGGVFLLPEDNPKLPDESDLIFETPLYMVYANAECRGMIPSRNVACSSGKSPYLNDERVYASKSWDAFENESKYCIAGDSYCVEEQKERWVISDYASEDCRQSSKIAENSAFDWACEVYENSNSGSGNPGKATVKSDLYRLYKDAYCTEVYPKQERNCHFTDNAAIGARVSIEQKEIKKCRRGNGLCVEGIALSRVYKYYSGEPCSDVQFIKRRSEAALLCK